MNVTTVEDAFKKVIRDYWKDKNLDQITSFKDKKYGKKYFKGLEEELLAPKDKADLKKKEKEYE